MEGGSKNRTRQIHQDHLDKTQELLQGCLSLCSMVRLFVRPLLCQYWGCSGTMARHLLQHPPKFCPSLPPVSSVMLITSHSQCIPFFWVPASHLWLQHLGMLSCCCTKICFGSELCCVLLKPLKNWIPGTSNLVLSTDLCFPDLTPCPSGGDEAGF